MNKYLKDNFNKLITLFLILSPILDVITGIGLHFFKVNISCGFVVRFLFLLMVFYVSSVIYKKKINYVIYGIVGVYFIFYLLSVVNGGYVFRELQGLFRCFYLPLLLSSLYTIKDEVKISKMAFVVMVCFYLLLIIIPNLFNVGFKSYAITKKGSLGFYNSANEISAIISILIPVLFLGLKDIKNIWFKVGLVFIYLLVILELGTKTPLLVLLITLFFTFIYILVKSKSRKLTYSFLGGIVVFILGLLIIIPKTNFYKNIKVHLNYLKVNEVTDVFKSEKLVDHFIFSQRLTFLRKKAKIYNESSFYQKMFGIGYYHNNKEIKSIEMDYFDIYYSHGLVGFIIFFTILIMMLCNILKNSISFSFTKYMLSLSLGFMMVLALFTGHVLVAPAVSSICALVIMMFNKRKEELIFYSYNLDLGGIEKALVNLVRRIDKNKYNVTVCLEKREGIFLDTVDSDVKVLEYHVYNDKNVFIRKIKNLLKRFIYLLNNYHMYNFSCCYATYSYSCNKLALLASDNNSIYVHSNYTHVYDTKECQEFFESRNFDRFKHIIFVSNEACFDYLKLYPHNKNKVLVFNNFVDVLAIKDMAKIRIELEKPKDKTLFVFVGRLSDDSKKLKRAIDLVKNIDDTVLWIVGDGEDYKLYDDYIKKEKLEKRVFLLGSKSNPYPYMKKADYIILTSDYEGFPVVYLEAIVLGKELITTVKVSDDFLKIGDNYGYVVARDEETMKKEVLKILKDRKKVSFDLENAQKIRMKKLEDLFAGGLNND